MAREELKWRNIDGDDLPADVKKSLDAMIEAEAMFKTDLEKLLRSEGHMHIVRFRSESGRQVPVPWARPRTVPDTTLDRIRCPAFGKMFPKNRSERAASGISPDTKNFFCKNVFHTKATPLWDRTIFGQIIVRGGMIKFSKWKVPPTGESSAP